MVGGPGRVVWGVRECLEFVDRPERDENRKLTNGIGTTIELLYFVFTRPSGLMRAGRSSGLIQVFFNK